MSTTISSNSRADFNSSTFIQVFLADRPCRNFQRFSTRTIFDSQTFSHSFRFGARKLDDFAPFLDFFSDEQSKIGGRSRNYGAS